MTGLLEMPLMATLGFSGKTTHTVLSERSIVTYLREAKLKGVLVTVHCPLQRNVSAHRMVSATA